MTLEKEALREAHEDIRRLKAEIAHVIIGQTRVIEQALICLVAAGHALIEGVPGLGKTLLVKSIARAIKGRFRRVQFTPDLMPSDITGHTLYDIKSQQWLIRRGPVFCNFLLADEINRAPAKTQAALLEVMQEHQVTIEGKSYQPGQPFFVLATQNPIEQEGTYPLPEAQLDRFLLNIKIGYPNEEEERHMAQRLIGSRVGDKLDLSGVNPVLSPERITALQQRAAALEVDAQIVDYAVRIARATRSWNGIEIGAGPRGSMALLRAARAQALLAGRHFVTPDDIKNIAPAVLRHRLVLGADYEIEGYGPDHVLNDILQNLKAPRL